MGSDDFCNTGLGLGLVLGLGFSSSTTLSKKPGKMTILEPSLTLSLSGETYDPIIRKGDADGYSDPPSTELYRQDSAASSFSNVSVKREREREREKEKEIGCDEVEIERHNIIVSSEDDDGSNVRKKLRLSKAQSALLEESFKQHSTLNPKQKQDLAQELNLRPRQVEVWFQNRRARTKLKQTEVDCEFLKKCCESLTDENRRLQKELQELKLAHPLYMQLPAATLTMCPSCERIAGGALLPENAAKSPYAMAPKTQFYSRPFSNQSAAC